MELFKIKSLTLLSLFIISAQAFAYIPPSDFQVNQIAKKKAHLDKLIITSSVNLIKNQAEETGIFFEKVQIDYKTGTLQSLILNHNQEILFFTEYSFNPKEDKNSNDRVQHRRIKSKIQSPGTLLLLLPNELDMRTPLMSRSIPIQKEEDLALLATNEERIAAETLSLRDKLKPVWVIGDHEKNKSQGELWVEKDSFLPQKLVWPFKNDEDKVAQLVMNGYKAFGSLIYPQEILYMTNEQPVLRVLTTQVDTSPQKIDWIPSSRQGWLNEDKVISPELKEAVDAYYKVIR